MSYIVFSMHLYLYYNVLALFWRKLIKRLEKITYKHWPYKQTSSCIKEKHIFFLNLFLSNNLNLESAWQHAAETTYKKKIRLMFASDKFKMHCNSNINLKHTAYHISIHHWAHIGCLVAQVHQLMHYIPLRLTYVVPLKSTLYGAFSKISDISMWGSITVTLCMWNWDAYSCTQFYIE